MTFSVTFSDRNAFARYAASYSLAAVMRRFEVLEISLR